MSEQQLSVKVNVNGKSMIIAYLLWWFLGWAGVHRFYLGRIGTGLGLLALSVIGVATAIFWVGYIFLMIMGLWWLLDAFFTQKIVTEENLKDGIEPTLTVAKSGNLASDSNQLDQLEKLHSLYEKGVLTQEQYEEKKAKLI